MEKIDLKSMSLTQLLDFAVTTRKNIIDNVIESGGHLASNLGAVELTIALHYVLNLPCDRLLFDVGHQCYTHKILSGRTLENFRHSGGVSGFCDITESEYDSYGSGHSGSAIAAAYGMCLARDKVKSNSKIVCVVGDGSLCSGEALETLNGLNGYKGQLLILLNDNGMSISKSSGGLYRQLSKLTVKRTYRNVKSKWKHALIKTSFGRGALKCLSSVKRFIKRIAGGDNMFEQMGIKYVGAVDGHNIPQLIKLLTDVVNCDCPVLLHVKTIKGKGYKQAEESPELFHGIGKGFISSVNTFSDSLSDILVHLKQNDDRIFAITAAMTEGTGLREFQKAYPNDFVDVGICEQTAVSLACGMTLYGIKPIVCIYSTFLQRAYDQIEQEVCLDGLPVIFCIDRAGFVGNDGKTHQGMFDIPLLRTLPNMTLLVPATIMELYNALSFAMQSDNAVAIRYNNGDISRLSSQTILKALPQHNILKWQQIQNGTDAVILACGSRMVENALSAAADSNYNVAVYNCTSIKPLDEDCLNKIYGLPIITIEEGAAEGGFGSSVAEYLSAKTASNEDINGVSANVLHKKLFKMAIMGVKNTTVLHANVNEQIEQSNLDSKSIQKVINDICS
ncbi:MAG: 1-deoxy-D-xylulose-5-phosphate synthase [Clostridia bacterium]